jgi:hypothetical protein
MIELIDELEDHVLGFRIEGKIGAHDLQEQLDDLNERLASHNQISFYVEVLDWEGISFEALLKDIKYGITHIQVLTQLNRTAVVTDEDWVKTLARWESKLFPGIEFKDFPLDQRDEALEWINQKTSGFGPALTAMTVDPPPADGDTPIFAYTIDGPITRQDIERIESDLKDQDKLNLLLHMKNFQAPRPNFLGSDWARMKLRALGQVNKYAVVGGPAWMDAIISFFDPIIKMDMRTFQEDELDKALEWLRE